MIRWRPCAGRPATNQRERERERQPQTLSTARRLYTLSWLPPSAAHGAAKHQPEMPVTTQGRGREETETEWTAVEREGVNKRE